MDQDNYVIRWDSNADISGYKDVYSMSFTVDYYECITLDQLMDKAKRYLKYVDDLVVNLRGRHEKLQNQTILFRANVATKH